MSADTLTIPAGKALFVMSGQALGESRWVPAWHATAIEIRPVRDYWSVSGFTMDYEDAEGDIWDMTLAPSVWR